MKYQEYTAAFLADGPDWAPSDLWIDDLDRSPEGWAVYLKDLRRKIDVAYYAEHADEPLLPRNRVGYATADEAWAVVLSDCDFDTRGEAKRLGWRVLRGHCLKSQINDPPAPASQKRPGERGGPLAVSLADLVPSFQNALHDAGFVGYGPGRKK
jgi:hypothetical protein